MRGTKANAASTVFPAPEIEGLFANRVMIPDAAHSRGEERLRAIGRTRRGRAIFVVFTIRDHGGKKYIRPISARYMHREEIAHYENENPEL